MFCGLRSPNKSVGYDVSGRSNCGHVIVEVGRLCLTHTWPSWQLLGAFAPVVSGLCVVALELVTEREKHAEVLTGSYKSWIHLVRPSERPKLTVNRVDLWQKHSRRQTLDVACGRIEQENSSLLTIHYSPPTVHQRQHTTRQHLLIRQEVCKTSSWPDSWPASASMWQRAESDLRTEIAVDDVVTITVCSLLDKVHTALGGFFFLRDRRRSEWFHQDEWRCKQQRAAFGVFFFCEAGCLLFNNHGFCEMQTTFTGM